LPAASRAGSGQLVRLARQFCLGASGMPAAGGGPSLAPVAPSDTTRDPGTARGNMVFLANL